MSLTTSVIIPRFSTHNSKLKYFIPRFAKIHKGDTIEWTNLDEQSHRLVFYSIIQNQVYLIGEIVTIAPHMKVPIPFNYDNGRIDYRCEIHGNEIGSVVIFPKREEEMSNTERLRFLSRIFDINPPDVYGHLRG